MPGLHANNFALLLAVGAPSVDLAPLVLAEAMLGAGVVHTFLDVVPALALGVPDAAMATVALPGHRLVLDSRGREGVRLSALGAGLAVSFVLPLAVPLTWAMIRVYPTLRAGFPLVVLALLDALLEEILGRRRRICAIAGLDIFVAVAHGLALYDDDVATRRSVISTVQLSQSPGLPDTGQTVTEPAINLSDVCQEPPAEYRE